MLTKVLRATVIMAVLLAVASPAWANNVTVILDDPTPTGGGGSPYQLTGGGPWDTPWQSCGNPPVPGYEGASGYSDCLALLNNVPNPSGPGGATLTSVLLTLTEVPALAGATLVCLDPEGASNNCGSLPTLSGSGTVTISFTGLDIPSNYEFFIGAGAPGENVPSNLPDAGVQVPTYDPGTLTLLAVGLAMLATGGAVRRYA